MTMEKTKKKTNKKKENKFFDTVATPSLIRRLVAEGIIPPSMFVRSLVVARNNSFLQKYGIAILAITGILYVVCAMAVLLSYEWNNIPFLLKPAAVLLILALSCALAYRKNTETLQTKFFIYLSFLLVGGLLFLGLNNPVFSSFVWTVFLTWFVISIPWVFVLWQDGLFVAWFLLFMAGVVCWGLEYALPIGLLDWSEFFPLAAVGAAAFLALRELCAFRYKRFNKSLSRLLPLFCCFSLAFTPVVLYVLELKGGSFMLSTAVFLLLFVLGFVLYYVLQPDLRALTLVVFFFCTFCAVLAYVNGLKYERWYSAFVFVVIPFGFFSWFMLRFRQIGENNKK